MLVPSSFRQFQTLKVLQMEYHTPPLALHICIYFYRAQVYLGSDLWVWVSLTNTPFADLTDVTLADDDTNTN